MNSKDFVRQAMKKKGVTQEELAKRMGYSHQTSISTLINTNGSLNVASFVSLISELGYELYVVDKEDEKRTKITDKKGSIKPRGRRMKKEIPVYQYK